MMMTWSPACKKSRDTEISLVTFLVNECTVADNKLPDKVNDLRLRAKITGKPKTKPNMVAGAMPDDSKVKILVAWMSLKRSANSSPTAFIKAASIW